jgi:hypothetical protein
MKQCIVMPCQIRRSMGCIALCIIALCFDAHAEELSIDFESAVIGKPMPSWSEKGVTFKLAHPPKKSKAIGRIMFFPHIGTERKGILNAMANEAIPLRVQFSKPVDNVTLVLWGSTTSAAIVEAYDADGTLMSTKKLEQVPVRRTPEEHVPFFELNVTEKRVNYLQVSGAPPGGFIAIDEVRWTESTEKTKE